MKTVVVLSTRQVDCLLDFIKAHPEHRYVLIYAANEQASIETLHLSRYFDALHCVDTTKRSQVLDVYDEETVRKIIKRELDQLQDKQLPPTDLSIVTQDEGNTETAAKMRTAFSLPGAKTAQVTPFYNKDEMKSVLKQHKIRVPEHQIIDETRLKQTDLQHYYQRLVTQLGPVFIVKPTESAGSYGVYKITCFDEFKAFKQQYFHQDAHQTYEAEEYIDGTLYHVDTVIDHDAIEFAYACQYTCPNMDFIQGHVLGSIWLPLDNPISKRLIAFTKECLQALGLPDGCQHTELFITNDNEIVFLETALRGPGVDVNKMYQTSFKTCPAELELYLATQTPTDKKYPFKPVCYSFWGSVPQKTGLFKTFDPPRFISDQVTTTMKSVPGERLPSPTCLRDCVATFFVSSQTADPTEAKEIQADFETLTNADPLKIGNLS